MPFWHGDRPGRPLELGRALGAFVREVRAAAPGEALAPTPGRLRARRAGGAPTCVQYLDEQAEATGVVPDDRTIVVERFRDEIGDWRVCVLSPFGTPVHAPWAMAIERRLADRYDLPVESMWGDDGIVLRLPEAADERAGRGVLRSTPTTSRSWWSSTLPQTALFSSRFRECAGRALLLPRRRPDQRTPLWQQRQRAADLLAVAAKYPTFPILLEASRECLQDVFDVPALREVLGQIALAAVRIVSVETTKPSPDGAEPAVQLDRRLHVRGRRPARRAAGGRAGTRPRPAARSARRRGAARAARPRGARRRRARPAAPLRRAASPLTPTSCTTCCAGSAISRSPSSTCVARSRPSPPYGAVDARRAARRAAGHRAGRRGEARYAAADDAARYRDALGCALPLGLPQAFTDPVPRPLEELVGRYARTHGPFVERDVAARFGMLRVAVRWARSAALEAEGRLVRGEFRPDGVAAGVVRRRRAAPAAAAVAGGVAPRGRAGRAGGARRVPARVARASGTTRRGVGAARRGDRRAGRRADRGVDARARRAGGAASPTIARHCSTSCARPARWCGSAPARSARTTAASGCASPTSSPCSLRAGSSAKRPTGRSTTPSAPCSPEGGRASGASCARAWSGRRTTSCSRRSGTWCGPARSRTTRWPRCGRPRRARRAERARPVVARRSGVHAAGRRGSGGSGRPAGAGRWSLVAPLLDPRADADRGGPRRGAATRRAPRRRDP